MPAIKFDHTSTVWFSDDGRWGHPVKTRPFHQGRKAPPDRCLTAMLLHMAD